MKIMCPSSLRYTLCSMYTKKKKIRETHSDFGTKITPYCHFSEGIIKESKRILLTYVKIQLLWAIKTTSKRHAKCMYLIWCCTCLYVNVDFGPFQWREIVWEGQVCWWPQSKMVPGLNPRCLSGYCGFLPQSKKYR